MAEPTIFERPYTGAYDDAVFAYVVAHPEPGPTYAEIKALLFPERPARPVESLPHYDPPQCKREDSWRPRGLDQSETPLRSSGVEPVGVGAIGLPLGIALGMMF